jgi:lipopolysaccharide transport system ATP-binding protein
MDTIAIRVENLTKTYSLNKDRPRTFNGYVRQLFKDANGARHKKMTALDKVTFTVSKGEAVGIIGRNGSGKSTLLKVLSGITKPTSGKAEIYGRVASVLDLGMGFHPDLSGLENIYLSGEMLGMSRSEIKEKVDEIIAFSELEKFIDTPVKYYSSGMFVRLAFSVIAHLEADILLMDEVISVGDASFQIKSYKKMQELLTSGKTILLVSHNLNSLTRFTSSCLYLHEGKLIGQGATEKMIDDYAESIFSGALAGSPGEITQQAHVRVWDDADNTPGNEYIKMRKILVRNENRTIEEMIYVDEKIVIEVEFEKLDTTESINIALRINDLNGNPLFITSPLLIEDSGEWKDYLIIPGYKTLKCIIHEHLFSSSVFVLDLFILENHNNILIFTIPYILSFSTSYKKLNGNLTLYKIANHPILPEINWIKNNT